MRRLGVVLALLSLMAPFAGCLEQIGSGLGRVAADPPAPRSYESSFEDFVAPSHAKRYPFLVEEGVVEVRAHVVLSLESELPVAPFSPAQVEVSFVDADGAPAGEKRTLSPQSPEGTIFLREFSAFGEYALVVTGNGLSGPPGGARYNATLQVSYAS